MYCALLYTALLCSTLLYFIGSNHLISQTGWNRCNICIYIYISLSLLYSTALLYSNLLYSNLLFSTLPYSTQLYPTLPYSALLCPTLPCSALLCPALLCSALLCLSALRDAQGLLGRAA